MLENHQPIAALKSTQFTDQAALNLVLEEEAKNTVLASIELGITIQPIRKLNFEGKASFSNFSSQTTSPSYKKHDPVQDYYCNLDIHYIVSKKIQIKWMNYLFHSSSKQSPTAFFSDISLSYLFKNNEFELLANNLFNNKRYSIRSMSSLIASTRTQHLHGAQLLIKYAFNFNF